MWLYGYEKYGREDYEKEADLAGKLRERNLKYPPVSTLLNVALGMNRWISIRLQNLVSWHVGYEWSKRWGRSENYR
ncbi:hypothetical protein AKJ64_01580 [candidate division MSBL1 archaeon SCGC-AAA259E17]|uniref:Uncharacterized protein n=1 Tax=candidate division MSBL1 archaeon SCGC-AAA259E17 TaxID=1698263 RepID=A0A133UFR9_9EURY|nr:hypothetical protein AKJ64_01580 [candidate division MSBL1 archaeon SCGC-AAA259E17]